MNPPPSFFFSFLFFFLFLCMPSFRANSGIMPQCVGGNGDWISQDVGGS